MSTTVKTEKINLKARRAKHSDIPGIIRLSQKTYGKDWAIQEDMLVGQLAAFPEGQFVTEYNGEIVGHCATFIIQGEVALKPHSWKEITGGGFAARHDPDGDYLYGMEVCVDQNYRGLRIGQRLYDCRKQICHEMQLKGIIFGGRMPNLARRVKQCGSPEAYLESVASGKLRDPVINFQLRNGFEIIGLLKNYLPFDKESLGYATHSRFAYFRCSSS